MCERVKERKREAMMGREWGRALSRGRATARRAFPCVREGRNFGAWVIEARRGRPLRGETPPQREVRKRPGGPATQQDKQDKRDRL